MKTDVTPQLLPFYACTWPERLTEVRRYGLLLGALKCVSWQVPDDLKARIESVLKEVE